MITGGTQITVRLLFGLGGSLEGIRLADFLLDSSITGKASEPWLRSLTVPQASSLPSLGLIFLHPLGKIVLLCPAPVPCPSLSMPHPLFRPQIVSSASTDLQDYTYYFVPAPWLSVKLLRLLQCYPPPGTTAAEPIWVGTWGL